MDRSLQLTTAKSVNVSKARPLPTIQGLYHEHSWQSTGPAKDVSISGPGDLFGTQQHGLPPFRIADLLRDQEVLIEARRDAMALIASDSGLSQPEHARLRRQVRIRYGKALELGDAWRGGRVYPAERRDLTEEPRFCWIG